VSAPRTGRPLTRTPGFWVAYALVALAALVVAWRLFPLAIPLVNLDVKLGRAEALARAEAIAARLHLVPDGARAAARFANDQAIQNYIELDGGGKTAFAGLVAGRVYAPYWWEVRLFKPGEVTEARVRFRPDGTGYGFVQDLPETWLPPDKTRAALASDVAQRIAEARASENWNVDLSAYTLLERSQQRRTNGRVDHAFVYQSSAGDIGEAHFRLRLTVTGDALTEVTYFAQVPESFFRRYQSLRSANDTIANVAALVAGLLYGLGGCILGTLWLLRRHWLLWRPALVAGLVVGGLLAAMSLSAAPTAWFGFDTAQSVTTFWTRQIGAALLIAFGGTIGFGLAFMAAEGLSRRAFGDHPQLWRAWSRDAAPTRAILGRTLGGYLFVPVELAFIALFYYATNRWLGWWQPSEALTDPNILGTAIPALSPIAQSLEAGFMEECVFRAVPLSLAALIGARFGRRRLAIGIAVVVQALVFGAAHANYPGFPAYSRLVELTVPAMVWALVFLRFGLLPTIILHGTFDLVLFAIPLFLVAGPAADVQRALVIAAALVPLAVVVARRLRAGSWREFPGELRNAAWRPPDATAQEVVHVADRQPAAVAGWIDTFQRSLPALGLAGFAAWILGTPFRTDVPPLPQDRAQAEAQAAAALAAQGVHLGPEWKAAALPKLAINDPTQAPWHEFVWREAGPSAYAKLLGHTLAPPLWETRYALFSGPVADRAEEWRVTVNGDGTPRLVRHTLPEGRAGPRLAREDALARAQRALRDRLGEDPHALSLVGAEERQRPERTDWSFVFADPRVDVGDGGQARVGVNVAGDEIASIGRFVHVPEEWERAQRERDGRLTIVKLALGACLALAALAAIVSAVLQWTRGHCDRRALTLMIGVAFALSAGSVANHWPRIEMGFSTAEPIASQASIAIAGSLLMGLLAALLVGLAGGVGAWAAQRQPVQRIAGTLPAWAAGVAAAVMTAGAGAAVEALTPRTLPVWPSYAIEAAWVPALAAAIEGARVLTLSAVALFVLHWLGRVTGAFTRRRWLTLVVLVLAFCAGAYIGGDDPVVAIAAGTTEGVLAAIVVYGLLRFDYRTVPAFLAADLVLQALATAAQKSTPAAWADCAALAATALVGAWLVIRYLERTRVEPDGARA
jgi:hypothetical protein